MATAVFFHAHPDDESIGTGGTMARLAAEGHRVILVTATGGELGEVPEGYLNPGETLTDRRQDELALSCEALGVARQVNLGYFDSGMDGLATNNDPACFFQADIDEAAAKLAHILTEENADVLVDYDKRGIYGHPDHVQVNRVGARAAELAGTPLRYMTTVNRDHLIAMMAEAAAAGEQREGPDQSMIDILGVHEDEITTAIDVTGYLDRKRQSLKAHGSQISDTSFFMTLDDTEFARAFGTEWFIRQGTKGGRPFDTTILPEGGA